MTEGRGVEISQNASVSVGNCEEEEILILVVNLISILINSRRIGWAVLYKLVVRWVREGETKHRISEGSDGDEKHQKENAHIGEDLNYQSNQVTSFLKDSQKVK